MLPKVSIIVAIYNVQEYLPQCLESLTAQTYENLEIFLVDDGSTDASGKLCDEWAVRDARFKVLHKVNGGQSSARNMGLDRASGDYIGFVDGDDFVDKDMYKYLVESAMQFSAQTVMSAVRTQDDAGEQGWLFVDGFQQRQVIDKETAMRLLINDIRISSSPWNKLYHRSLFDTLRFPEGMVYEDKAVMHALLHQCETIAIDQRAVYFYRLRAGSTTKKAFSERNFDQLKAGEMRYEFYQKYYPQFAKEVKANICKQAMIQTILAAKGGAPKQMRMRLKPWVRQNRRDFWASREISLQDKLMTAVKYRFFELMAWRYQKTDRKD